MKKLLLSLFAIAVVPALSAEAKPGSVVPGVSVGNLRLGATRAVIHKLRGKPTRTAKTHQGCTADSWMTPNTLLQTEVVYRSDRAIQIAVTSNQFATPSGLSTASTHARIEKALPRAKETVYFYDTESGRGLEYHDDVAQGLAFVFISPWKQDTRVENPMDETPWLLVVHQRGQPGLPTKQGQNIPDLSNNAVQDRRRGKRATSTAVGSREVACRTAVQGFYDWYAKVLAKDSREITACMQAVKSRPQWFSPELRRALAEDAAAQAKSPGEIVGLNADPFVFASDPAPRYVVGWVARDGSRYRADILPVLDGEVRKSPSVVAEVEQRHGQWVFVDFVYPPQAAGEQKHNLRGILRSKRDHRKKQR